MTKWCILLAVFLPLNVEKSVSKIYFNGENLFAKGNCSFPQCQVVTMIFYLGNNQ